MTGADPPGITGRDVVIIVLNWNGGADTVACLESLAAADLQGASVLVVDNADNRNLQLSSRNLEGVKLVASRDVNVYDLLGHQHVLLSEAAARKLSEALA